MLKILKPSERIALAAFAAAAVLVGLFWWYVPDAPWWVYAGLLIFIATCFGQTWLRMSAEERIVDEGRR